MTDVEVHPRVSRRHPELTEADIQHAWHNAYYEALRPDSPNFPEYVRIGIDKRGREIEMVATATRHGLLVYHANTPVSKSVLDEIQRNERRR